MCDDFRIYSVIKPIPYTNHVISRNTVRIVSTILSTVPTMLFNQTEVKFFRIIS